MDYRWAVFSDYGCPTMPGPRDCNVIWSSGQYLLNTGVIYHPSHVRPAFYNQLDTLTDTFTATSKVSSFDPHYFDGVTTDDLIED